MDYKKEIIEMIQKINEIVNLLLVKKFVNI